MSFCKRLSVRQIFVLVNVVYFQGYKKFCSSSCLCFIFISFFFSKVRNIFRLLAQEVIDIICILRLTEANNVIALHLYASKNGSFGNRKRDVIILFFLRLFAYTIYVQDIHIAITTLTETVEEFSFRYIEDALPEISDERGNSACLSPCSSPSVWLNTFLTARSNARVITTSGR